MDSGQQVQEECRLQLQDHCRVMDLEAVATPFTTAGRTYTIVSLRDIAGDKRREMLERLFFHDVINTAGGLHGLARTMLDLGPSADDLRILVQVSDQLMEELHNQRDLIAAERGKLLPDPQPVRLDALLTGLRDLYARHTVARGRTVQLLSAPAMTATTDTVLLRRAVGNLVKNALEASQRDEAVTMTLHADGDAAVITVHNPAVMNDDIRLQVFQRSFSTKGAGRGLGTYSARLLVERCLGGSLVLVSEEGRGTTVTVRVPLRFPSSLPRR
jgi:signal transduction histidine kinase